MVAKARYIVDYHLHDERVQALVYWLNGWEMEEINATPHPSLNKQGLADYLLEEDD